MNYDIDIDPRGEYDFAEWSYRSIIADCLTELNYKRLANLVLVPSLDGDFIQDCLNVVENEARRRKDSDMIDRLAMSGLVYG